MTKAAQTAQPDMTPRRDSSQTEDAQADEAALVVLKFSSSVLRRRRDLPRAVGEIYRYVRRGVKVVATVAALDEETERLRAEAAGVGRGLDSPHSAGLVALGETRAAYALALACDHSGVAARVVEGKELGLSADGSFDDARLVGVDLQNLEAALARADVVIAPGYVAVDGDGRPALLGRGGADLTATALAAALGIGEATFLTDVGGLFDRDPLTPERVWRPEAKRFSRVTWGEVGELAGDPIQAKALGYAEAHGVKLSLRAPGADAGTLVGPEGAPPRTHARPQPTRVGVAGLGVVGEGAALRLVDDPQRYALVATLVSDGAKKRHRQIDPSRIETNLEAFLDAGLDVVVDAMSDGEAGRRLAATALARGVSVVTANKQAICDDLPELSALARDNGAHLAYAPTVGGGAPMLETARRAAARGVISEIIAVLNGTVNFILSEVCNGARFVDALKAAQEAGFAEADPSADLSGEDARAKGKILAFDAFGADPARVTTDIEALDGPKADGIAGSGGTWRQVARITPAEGGGAHVAVRYARVDDDPFLAGLVGEENALRATTPEGVLACRGRGAGRAPTVESALADLGDIVRARAAGAAADAR